MYQSEDYDPAVSTALSEVLNDIGVNERIVMKRRRAKLLFEAMETVNCEAGGFDCTYHHFGSQSEGTTTIQLNSDLDSLVLDHRRFNVIQDIKDWKPGRSNLLMVQDETTSPGYCLLQCLNPEVPEPLTDIPNKFYQKDSKGRILFANTLLNNMPNKVLHGPSQCLEGRPGLKDRDFVWAFPCRFWPAESKPWLKQKHIGKWPTDQMLAYCKHSGCFVVPVSSRNGRNLDLEWRISTSFAERCLMFNLNITQIRCYVLLKMILKTYIDPEFKGVISSFMCKTVLFHSIAGTHPKDWRENNLILCLIHCLLFLRNCVEMRNCPHFITPGNNLMRGRIPDETKLQLIKKLDGLLNIDELLLFMIQYDDLGLRMMRKLNVTDYIQRRFKILTDEEMRKVSKTPRKVHEIISGELAWHTATYLSYSHRSQLNVVCQSSKETVLDILMIYLSFLRLLYTTGNTFEKRACYLLAPLICSTIGSIKASRDIEHRQTVSVEALDWFSLGIDNDVSSGRLKLAAAFYCAGQLDRMEIHLNAVECKYDRTIVEPWCNCYDYFSGNLRSGFCRKCHDGNECTFREVTGFCVRFMQCEMSCITHELKYELFRSTKAEIQERSKDDKRWMDLAVVDSLPFLYYMQYKLYSSIHSKDKQQMALRNLAECVNREPCLAHRETALNLLGQCLENENLNTRALGCYIKSLEVRPQNNVANWHMCRVLAGMIRKERSCS